MPEGENGPSGVRRSGRHRTFEIHPGEFWSGFEPVDRPMAAATGHLECTITRLVDPGWRNQMLALYCVWDIYGELTSQLNRLAKIQSQVDELRDKIRRIVSE